MQLIQEKAPERPFCGLLALKGAAKKDGERYFSRAYCDMTRADDFKLRVGRFRLEVMKV